MVPRLHVLLRPILLLLAELGSSAEAVVKIP